MRICACLVESRNKHATFPAHHAAWCMRCCSLRTCLTRAPQTSARNSTPLASGSQALSALSPLTGLRTLLTPRATAHTTLCGSWHGTTGIVRASPSLGGCLSNNPRYSPRARTLKSDAMVGKLKHPRLATADGPASGGALKGRTPANLTPPPPVQAAGCSHCSSHDAHAARH